MDQKGKLSLLAVASVILGIISFLGWSVLTGIPALILGYVSRSKIKNSDGKLDGKNMSLAGIIMGYLSIVLLIGISIFSRHVDSELQVLSEKISAMEQAKGTSDNPPTITNKEMSNQRVDLTR